MPPEMYLLNKLGQLLSKATFLDSRFSKMPLAVRGNDGYVAYFVIPAKAGIQESNTTT